MAEKMKSIGEMISSLIDVKIEIADLRGGPRGGPQSEAREAARTLLCKKQERLFAHLSAATSKRFGCTPTDSQCAELGEATRRFFAADADIDACLTSRTVPDDFNYDELESARKQIMTILHAAFIGEGAGRDEAAREVSSIGEGVA
jgi:hypothetical protein